MTAQLRLTALAMTLGACVIASLGATRLNSTASNRATAYCLGPDAVSDAELSYLQGFVRATDSSTVAFRSLVHVPSVADTAVHLVTDDSVCAHVVSRWAADESAAGVQPPFVAQLYVFSVGSVYVATQPLQANSHYQQYLVVDSSFATLAPYLR